MAMGIYFITGFAAILPGLLRVQLPTAETLSPQWTHSIDLATRLLTNEINSIHTKRFN